MQKPTVALILSSCVSDLGLYVFRVAGARFALRFLIWKISVEKRVESICEAPRDIVHFASKSIIDRELSISNMRLTGT